jgi:uncharacterized protein (TIGR02391 family)
MIDLSTTDFEALPLDERGFLVLRDLVTTYPPVRNERSYVKLYSDRPTQLLMAEAIGWLRARVFLAKSPTEQAAEAFFLTKRGREALEQDIQTVRAAEQIERGLHPAINQRARRQFLLGEYEQAVFVSMKAVEVRTRALAKFGDDVYGVDLMRKAFNPNTPGPLTDPFAPKGEQEGTMFLFTGAYAVLRNPAGHREVDYDDVTEAAEAIATASLLMRILDRVERRLNNPGT